MGPYAFPSDCVYAVEGAHGVGAEEQSVGDGGGAHGVATQRVRPQGVGGADVPLSGGAYAADRGFVLAPEPIAATGDVHPVSEGDGHSVDIAGTFASVVEEASNVGLGSAGVEVKAPGVLEDRRFGRGVSGAVGIEAVDDAVAAGKKDAWLAVDGGEGGGGPGAMEDARGDAEAVVGDPAAGAFVEHHEAGGLGCADDAVGVVYAGAGVDVEVVAMDEDGAVGSVMGPDAGLPGEVEGPEDVGVGHGRGDGDG